MQIEKKGQTLSPYRKVLKNKSTKNICLYLKKSSKA